MEWIESSRSEGSMNRKAYLKNTKVLIMRTLRIKSALFGGIIHVRIHAVARFDLDPKVDRAALAADCAQ